MVMSAVLLAHLELLSIQLLVNEQLTILRVQVT